MHCGLKSPLSLARERLRLLLTRLQDSAAVDATGREAAAERVAGMADIMVGVCFTAGIDIALLSLQIHSQLPMAFCFVLLAVLFAFSSFFMSKFLASKFPIAARVLERAGVFFAVTGFFIAISIPFPLCLQIITWIVYSICLLVLVLYVYFFG